MSKTKIPFEDDTSSLHEIASVHARFGKNVRCIPVRFSACVWLREPGGYPMLSRANSYKFKLTTCSGHLLQTKKGFFIRAATSDVKQLHLNLLSRIPVYANGKSRRSDKWRGEEGYIEAWWFVDGERPKLPKHVYLPV